MERITFALRAHPGMRGRVEASLRARAAEMQTVAAREGIGNFSIWGIEDLFFGYGERAAGHPAGDGCAALRDVLMAALNGDGEMLCDLGTMRLMYHVEGTVCEDKSLIRHRVFSTRLKPGCEEEYKRRHDALGATQSAESPESNFTIWCGAGYIFGYCEIIKAREHAMTMEERASTIAWETRQLEIMDWLTDDVDWITGEKHEAIRRIV
ncbi:MAG TPA: L-rhamnose mutarotase [Candidatus Pullichristensenella excrementipullorum]|nr:L-rhamnose mutarotase [Candidatus Pullichristensenella excrementipullorum]